MVGEVSKAKCVDPVCYGYIELSCKVIVFAIHLIHSSIKSAAG